MKTIILPTGVIIKQDKNGNIKSIKYTTLDLCTKPIKQ